jgi:hypothetical protein
MTRWHIVAMIHEVSVQRYVVESILVHAQMQARNAGMKRMNADPCAR